MRMLGGEDSQKDLSEFVAKSQKQDQVSWQKYPSCVAIDGIDDVLVGLAGH
jgi:hypothetical protein